MLILLTRYEIRLIDFEGTMKSPNSQITNKMTQYVHVGGLVGGILSTVMLIGQNFKNYKGINYYMLLEVSLGLLVFVMRNGDDDD